MNKKSMRAAQKYLTCYKNDIRKRIVDIRRLSRDHTTQEIIAFLKDYLREKEKGLKNMLLIDRTNRRVDEMIAAIFRLYMAIQVLEEDRAVLQFAKQDESREKMIIKSGKEVSGIDATEQGATTGGRLYQGDSGRDRRPGQREDQDHDGENRYPGHETRRAA